MKAKELFDNVLEVLSAVKLLEPNNYDFNLVQRQIKGKNSKYSWWCRSCGETADIMVELKHHEHCPVTKLRTLLR